MIRKKTQNPRNEARADRNARLPTAHKKCTGAPCHLRTGMVAPARSHVLCTQGLLKGVFALVSLKTGFQKILYHAYYSPYTTVLLTVSQITAKIVQISIANTTVHVWFWPDCTTCQVWLMANSALVWGSPMVHAVSCYPAQINVLLIHVLANLFMRPLISKRMLNVQGLALKVLFSSNFRTTTKMTFWCLAKQETWTMANQLRLFLYSNLYHAHQEKYVYNVVHFYFLPFSCLMERGRRGCC